jgi:aryl-alcohol dehydrogenase-like predicted oxidoreductase
MYPVNPVKAATVGRSEEIIGSWIAARGRRDRLVLATKVSGGGQTEVRGGEGYNATVIRRTVDASLRRLGTDYIDLYQLHWPNRAAYHFRNIWTFDPRSGNRAKIEAEMVAILEVFAQLIGEGKVRHIGFSNETVWGAAQWLWLARTHNLPMMQTVQNEYSLLCRQFDSDWAELSVLEDMPLLAFSPLATGLLSGKYAGDVTPEGSRRRLNPTLSGRITPQVFPAVAAYLGIAARHGLDPCQMAIAWTRNRPFTTIPIIGATTDAQLETDMGAAGLTLGADVLADISAAHAQFPQPY